MIISLQDSDDHGRDGYDPKKYYQVSSVEDLRRGFSLWRSTKGREVPRGSIGQKFICWALETALITTVEIPVVDTADLFLSELISKEELC